MTEASAVAPAPPAALRQRVRSGSAIAGGAVSVVSAAESVARPEAVAPEPLTRRRAREQARTGAELSAAAMTPSSAEATPSSPAEVTPTDVALAGSALLGAALLDAALTASDGTTDEQHAPVVAIAEVVRPAESSASRVEGVIPAEAADRPARPGVDEFETAARLFAFTGETPVQVATAARAQDEPVAVGAADERSKPGRRRSIGASFRRVTAASATIGAMGIVGLLAVGMTTPAEAVAAANGAPSSLILASSKTSASNGEIQAYIAPADTATASLARGDYQTESMAQIAAASGVTHYSDFYTNNANSDIQWPFPVGVSISYGFGMRDGSMHEGLDFTPGEGAHIQAIADGTVRIATESGDGYGVMIIIDHIIDGKLVSTRYGHMLYGSLQVKTGDRVHVGQVIGYVGDTGYSFGAHLHFEVLLNGTTAIDPLPWLREYTDGTHTVG